MWAYFAYMIDRFDPRPVVVGPAASGHDAVVIRRACDADLGLLHDLAGLDSAAPLTGPVLVAVVEGRPWAALDLDSDRVIADPFLPATAAVALLRLRARQLRSANGRSRRRARPRRVVRRVRA